MQEPTTFANEPTTAGAQTTERSRRLYAMYGITVEQYDALLVAQHGVCLICRVPHFPTHPLVVDHNHLTGKVRGLLCNECNTGIGLLGDNPTTLESAVNYLQTRGDYATGGLTQS